MFCFTSLPLVLLVVTISTQTGAVPQSQATQNAMELELSNILETASTKSTIPQAALTQQDNQHLLSKVMESAVKKSSISQAKQESNQEELSNLLESVEKESSIPKSPQSEGSTISNLKSSDTKSSIPQGLQTQIVNNDIMQPAQTLVVKNNIPLPNFAQQALPVPSNVMTMQAQGGQLQKYSNIPPNPIQEQQNSQKFSTFETKPIETMHSNIDTPTVNITNHQLVPENMTLPNGTVMVKNINSSIAINGTQLNSTKVNATAPAQAPVQVKEPVEVIPHFKNYKEEAKWKMNKAREMLLKAKQTTEQALEYAHQRSVKVNKENKDDVDEIIKKTEIALVHVGDHIGLEYKHYK